jgi:branched-chain amino acid transport system ATP-binding protein
MAELPDAAGEPTAATAPALVVEDLAAGYGGVIALHGVSLSVGQGAITAVLGANGAGKTTLLRAVSGQVRARRGAVRLDGAEVTRRRPDDLARAGIAHVPEGQGVITELTVEENLRLGALCASGRTSRADRATALAQAYEQFPVLAARRRKPAGTLSGGERQMLVIARALLTRPRLLLLDEPSLGLAPKIINQVMTLIAGLRQSSGLAILLVEQNARSALTIADRGVVLAQGKVVATADAATLASDTGLLRHYLGL